MNKKINPVFKNKAPETNFSTVAHEENIQHNKKKACQPKGNYTAVKLFGRYKGICNEISNNAYIN